MRRRRLTRVEEKTLGNRIPPSTNHLKINFCRQRLTRVEEQTLKHQFPPSNNNFKNDFCRRRLTRVEENIKTFKKHEIRKPNQTTTDFDNFYPKMILAQFPNAYA